jgi:hypothetical protein
VECGENCISDSGDMCKNRRISENNKKIENK